jgi:hypothetical protein
MADQRDDFPIRVVEALGKRAAYICSNPECRTLSIAPCAADDQKYLYIGKAAHICAAAPGGPRYDIEMTPEERSSPSNGIFLCSNCAEMIDKNDGIDFPVELLRSWKSDHEIWIAANLNKRRQDPGIGGKGGSGRIVGNRGVIFGGKGGDGGVAGLGGSGGDGFIQGDDGMIIGGDGGSASASDGRGGRGARGPTERFGFSTATWGCGRGGSGPNHPEYDRRIAVLTEIRAEYMKRFPEDVPYIEAGIDVIPTDWVNQRLVELEQNWQVALGRNGYELPHLAPTEFNR